MNESTGQLLSGNEAIAFAAFDAGVTLGCGYPGTPSTEILENLARLGAKAQWSPNEKVALEVGLGVAYAGGASLVTMKHVGMNVAADPLFTAAYTGVNGALVLVSADDPGMASSQNEQDNRRYAHAAGVAMLEPSDSQEAYDFTIKALELSHKHRSVVMLRLTTRCCHSKTIVRRWAEPMEWRRVFERDIQRMVMVPAFARKAHRRLRGTLEEMTRWNEQSDINAVHGAGEDLGIIASGVAFMHSREACPDAKVLKLGMTHPLPMEKIRQFASSVKRCVVIEEGDPYLVDSIRAAGIAVEGADTMYRFGELSVGRVRRIIAGDLSPEPQPTPGKPPQLCKGCPHRVTFEALRDLGCIVAGDIGCYTLGVLPPFNAMDTCVCMGASISVGVGMRHSLDEKQARKVVSVIGDSTFVHSGITGLIEMVYNPPSSGHVVIILDNGTTAMTGLQEHPGTGRTLDHQPTNQIVFEDLIRSLGIENVHVVDPVKDHPPLRELIGECLANGQLNVVIVRRPCLLAAKRIKQYNSSGDRN